MEYSQTQTSGSKSEIYLRLNPYSNGILTDNTEKAELNVIGLS